MHAVLLAERRFHFNPALPARKREKKREILQTKPEAPVAMLSET